MEKICAVVAFGLAGTASIIIGREIGAGRASTVQEVGKALNTLAALCGVVMGVVLLLFVRFAAPGVVYPIFQLSPGAQTAATMMLMVHACIMPLKDFNTTNIVGVLRGGGDVTAATLIDLIPLWFVAIPLAFLSGIVLRLDVLFIYLSLSMEQLVKAAAGVWRLGTGRWVRDLTGGTGESDA